VKRLLLTCLIFFLAAPLIPQTQESGSQAARPAAKKPHRVLGEMPFSYSYEETLNLARKNNKPIFAYFTFET
jgi:hypothetical protein